MLGVSLRSLQALTHQTPMNWEIDAVRELRPHSLQWFLPKTFMVELLPLNLLSTLIDCYLSESFQISS